LQPLTNVERRMTDRVVRDVSVVTQVTNGGGELVVTRTGAVVGPQTFFDDATNGVGSFTDPGELPAMITAGGENALLIGLDTTGDVLVGGFNQAELTLFNGQTVMGGGTDLRVWGAQSGQSAVFRAPGSPATLDGAPLGGAAQLTLAHNNTIAGLTFQNAGVALYLPMLNPAEPESTMADIYNNDFWNLGDAVFVHMQNDSDLKLYLTDNDFLELTTAGLDLVAGEAFNIEVEAHGNTFALMDFAGLAHTLLPDGSGPSSFALNASGNTFDAWTYGIFTNAFVSGVNGPEAYTHTANISNNDFVNNLAADYFLTVAGAAAPDVPGEVDVDVAVQGNRSVWSDNFVEILIDPIPAGHIDIDVVDNEVLEPFDTAVGIFILDGPDVDATIARNEIQGIRGRLGDAIHIDILDSGDEDGHVVTVSDNDITGTADDAIEVNVAGGLDTDLTVANNDLSLIGGQGVNVGFFDVGALGDESNTVTFEGNTLRDSNGTGLNFVATDGAATAVTVTDNSVSFVDIGGGIEVGLLGVGDLADEGNAITINRNTVEFTDLAGIDVNVASAVPGDAGDTAVTVSDNNLSFITGRGIDVSLLDVGQGGGNTIAIDRNTLDTIVLDAIQVDATISDVTTLGMAGNDISNTFGDGIRVDFEENLGQAITINGGNTIAFAGLEPPIGFGGISVDVDGLALADTEVTVADNTVEHVGTNGIRVEFRGVLDGELTVRNNVVDGSDWNGININLDEDFGIEGSGGNEVTIANNLVSNTLGDGIELNIDDDSDLNLVTIQSNQISHGENDGVWVHIRDGSDGNEVTIASNQITDSWSNGVNSAINDFSDLNVVTVRNNRITDSGLHGLEFVVADFIGDSDGNTLVAETNTISLSGLNGIDVDVLGGLTDGTSLVIGGNSIDLSNVNGIDIVAPFLPLVTNLSSEINGAERNNTVTNFVGVDAFLVGDFTGQLLVNGTLVP
jgi:hypothetical protein